jgi:hypothetical protein
MKKKQRKHRHEDTDSTVIRKPLRKIQETKDGGLILDDRDAEEPFLAPITRRSVAKKVA